MQKNLYIYFFVDSTLKRSFEGWNKMSSAVVSVLAKPSTMDDLLQSLLFQEESHI